MTKDPTPKEISGKYLVVWRRGEWKLAADIWNDGKIMSALVLADICSAAAYVRFTPAGGGALVHVRFVPIADTVTHPREPHFQVLQDLGLRFAGRHRDSPAMSGANVPVRAHVRLKSNVGRFRPGLDPFVEPLAKCPLWPLYSLVPGGPKQRVVATK